MGRKTCRKGFHGHGHHQDTAGVGWEHRLGVGEGANSLPVGYIRMAPRCPQKVTSELLLKGEWGSQRREEGESLSQAKKACSRKQRQHTYAWGTARSTHDWRTFLHVQETWRGLGWSVIRRHG